MGTDELGKNCSGCGLCAELCPQNAIDMRPDSKGFLRPVINEEECVNCEKCVKNCTFIHIRQTNSINIFYAAKNKNKSIVRNSSSGGIFSALASKIISDGGVVYGVAYNWKEKTLDFVRVITIDDIRKCQGSKYVQSNNLCFEKIGNDLLNGKKVLVTGCPCQIDACESYLSNKKISQENLMTCDLICHGVPSPRIWKDFIIFLEKHYHDTISDFSFRYKSDTCKWGTVNTSAKFQNKELVNTKYVKSFIKIYFNNLMTRPDCSMCPYTSLSRVSDITLADCWGIEDVDPNFNDRNGVSLVKINTPNGKTAFESIAKDIDYIAVDTEKLNQPHLYSPCAANEKCEAFWEDYNSLDYRAIAKKYAIEGFWHKMQRKAKEYHHAIMKRL